MIVTLRSRDSHIANHLLLALFSGGGARFADETTSSLCGEPWRFQCGVSGSSHWYAMEAIGAAFPHCTAESRNRLEATILRYVPTYERTARGYQQSGRSQFSLLSAIPTELRSPRANARFDELARKFGEPEGEPQGITMTWVGPPIERKATDQMTDDQWLRAITKHRSELSAQNSLDRPKGGARELAQVLETRAQEEPDRFARLCLRFPADANPVYLRRMLDALGTADAVSDLKLQVCRKALDDSLAHCSKSIADVLGSIKDTLPDDAIAILHRLATEQDDPAAELWQEDSGGGANWNSDIHTTGINTTRGRAAEAVRNLIRRDAEYVERFRDTLERIIRDPSASVLSCVAGTLRAVAHRDPSLGKSLFLRMNIPDDRLLATGDVCEYIRYGLRDSFAELRPFVERMLQSSEPRSHRGRCTLGEPRALDESARCGPRGCSVAWRRAAPRRCCPGRIREHHHTGVSPLVRRDACRAV